MWINTHLSTPKYEYGLVRKDERGTLFRSIFDGFDGVFLWQLSCKIFWGIKNKFLEDNLRRN